MSLVRCSHPLVEIQLFGVIMPAVVPHHAPHISPFCFLRILVCPNLLLKKYVVRYPPLIGEDLAYGWAFRLLNAMQAHPAKLSPPGSFTQIVTLNNITSSRRSHINNRMLWSGPIRRIAERHLRNFLLATGRAWRSLLSHVTADPCFSPSGTTKNQHIHAPIYQ